MRLMWYYGMTHNRVLGCCAPNKCIGKFDQIPIDFAARNDNDKINDVYSLWKNSRTKEFATVRRQRQVTQGFEVDKGLPCC